jgi:hypothetical protein
MDIRKEAAAHFVKTARCMATGGMVTSGKTRNLQKRLAGRKGYAARMKKKKSD